MCDVAPVVKESGNAPITKIVISTSDRLQKRGEWA